MLHEVSGDILLSRARAIAHGVAPNDDYNQGLAHALRENWPAMYKDFRHYCHTTHPKSGTMWAWAGADGKQVVSLFTQDASVRSRRQAGPGFSRKPQSCLESPAQMG